MTIEQSTPEAVVWVAIDVAKDRHEALIEAPGWRSRKKFRVQNTAEEFRSFAVSSTVLLCRSVSVSSPRATTIGRLPIFSIQKDFNFNLFPRWPWPVHAR